MRYRFDDEKMPHFEADSPHEFVTKMREIAFDSEPSNRAYMKAVADRIAETRGVFIHHTDEAGFLKDLLYFGIVFEQPDRGEVK